ncbi:MAG TPA: TIGR04282 family arsenosugar biosynthesis glycosyltransferase [Burkholderiales bacterium]|nr:TIGR04282 family arsenosugar biosynthesis glycosyltransferase [Burkholderiales bacterium]
MNGKEAPSCRVLVFAKAPIPGQVKTRLIPLLGEEGASALFKRLVHHTLQVATSTASQVELWCSPCADHAFFADCAGWYKVRLRKQGQGSLGARLCAAASESLKSSAYVIIVGCDCPMLNVQDLAEATRALAEGADAVLGPAADGGYYLIGLRRYDARVFSGIDWGSEKVLEQTRERLKDLKWTGHELDMKWDLDVPEDYERFVSQGILLGEGYDEA